MNVEPAARLLPCGEEPDSLEEAALDLLTRIPRPGSQPELYARPLFSRDQAVALARRKGWDGRPAGTLQDAGDAIGVSRERVRQLEVRLDEWTAAKTVLVESIPIVLDDAVAVALSTRPSALALELRQKRLAVGDWTLRSVAELLRICRRNDLDQALEDASRLSTIGRCAVSAVWEASGKLGFAHRDAIRRNLEQRFGHSALRDISDLELDDVLNLSDGVMALPHGYFFAAPYRDPTVIETTYRMLQVVQPLSLRDVRNGLRRRCRFRKIPFKVPLAALRRFFELSLDFEIDDEGDVRMRTRRPSADDTLQQWIVDELRASDYGLLTRNQVMQRARRARKNMNSVSIYLTYGEQIAHDPRGFYYPIGCLPDESLIAEGLAVAGATVRRTTQSWHYDDGEGVVVLLIELGDSALSSGVVFADAQSRSYLDLLGDAHFALRDEDGDSYGTLHRSEPMNAVTGLATFFARTYPEPGDVLRLDIDLKSMTALAEIGGSEINE